MLNINENEKKRTETFRLLVANVLRRKGFEVYALPMNGKPHIPHLVAFKDNKFHNIYLFESRQQRNACFDETLRADAFAYARPLNAAVVTAWLKISIRKHDLKVA